MDDKDRARLERARGRASWPVEAQRLTELQELELVEGQAAELIGMVRELTLAAWAMSGQPMPEDSRHDAVAVHARLIALSALSAAAGR